MGELTRESYPGGLVQIVRRRGRIERVRPGVEPVVELHLEPGQYVVGLELHEIDYRHRKTSDWFWTAYVATQLGGGAYISMLARESSEA